MALAFVFPGQGSHSVGMMNALAAVYPVVEHTFAEASDVLKKDLWSLVQNGPETALNQTEVTQPVMLVAGVATWRVWKQVNGPEPQLMAGHSLGEYSALVCADSITFTDAVQLVADRARFMQEAVPAGQGGIAAILGLEDDAVRALCEREAQGETLDAVNFNSPNQVVIAGSAAAVARAVEASKAAGAKRAVVLPMSVPAHSRLMQPAAKRMAGRVQSVDVRAPRIPIIHNAHLKTESDAASIRTALVRQIDSPVRWTDTILKMTSEGISRIVECGPGKVLTGLNKRIAKQVETFPVFDPDSVQDTLSKLS